MVATKVKGTVKKLRKAGIWKDDTIFVVHENNDVCFLEEFNHIKEWARKNKMPINMLKTKEIIFGRPNPRLCIMLPPSNEIDQVTEIKQLGVIFYSYFNFESHKLYHVNIKSAHLLNHVIKWSRIVWRKFWNYFQALAISRLGYALSSWGSLITTEQCGRINAFLKRSMKYGLTQKCFHIKPLSDNCLHSILPPTKSSLWNLRAREHNFELPVCNTIIRKQSFTHRCLFYNMISYYA